MPTELDDQLDAELAAQGGQMPAVVPETPVSPAPEPVQPAQQPAVQPTVQAPVQAAPTQADAAAQAAGYANTREFLAKELGWNEASQYGDDRAALQAMLASVQSAKEYQRRLQELQPLAQYGQLYLQSRQQQQQPAQQPADPLAAYKGPEWNPAWTQSLAKAEDGSVVLRPGANPEILAKYHAYRQHQTDLMEKFTNSPVEFLQPLIQTVAAQQAQQIVQQQLESLQNNSFVGQVQQTIAPWYHERDAAGNVVVNPATGRPIVSVYGQRYMEHLQEAEKYGIRGHQAQHAWAIRGLQAAMAVPTQQTTAVVQNDAANRQRLLQEMNRRPNVSGSTVAASGAPGADQNSNLSLADQMRAAFRSSNITDEAIQMDAA